MKKNCKALRKLTGILTEYCVYHIYSQKIFDLLKDLDDQFLVNHPVYLIIKHGIDKLQNVQDVTVSISINYMCHLMCMINKAEKKRKKHKKKFT